MQQIETIANDIISLINTVAIPLVFAIAFLVFIYGVFNYFIAGGANEEKRKQGKQLVIYSVVGFAVMICVWGLVNLIIGTLGFSSNAMPALPTFNSGSNTGQINGMDPIPTNNGLISPETTNEINQQAQVEAQTP